MRLKRVKRQNRKEPVQKTQKFLFSVPLFVICIYCLFTGHNTLVQLKLKSNLSRFLNNCSLASEATLSSFSWSFVPSKRKKKVEFETCWILLESLMPMFTIEHCELFWKINLFLINYDKMFLWTFSRANFTNQVINI